jgi:hypothetical protein
MTVLYWLDAPDGRIPPRGAPVIVANQTSSGSRSVLKIEGHFW